MRYDMESYVQGEENEDKASLHGPVARATRFLP